MAAGISQGKLSEDDLIATLFAPIAGPGALAIGTARTFDIGDSSSSVNEIIISAPVSGGSITKIGAESDAEVMIF